MMSYKLKVTFTNGDTKTYRREGNKNDALFFLFTLGDHVSDYSLKLKG